MILQESKVSVYVPAAILVGQGPVADIERFLISLFGDFTVVSSKHSLPFVPWKKLFPFSGVILMSYVTSSSVIIALAFKPGVI